MIRWWSLPLLFATAALARPSKPPPRTPAMVERGKATYAIYCISCHGDHGAGDGSVAQTLNPRPRNFATDKFKQGSGITQIFGTLARGIPGTAMTKFTNLSEEERWALAWYVVDLKNGRVPR